MQADEAGTLAALKSRHSEILQPLLAKHHGRIVKLVGDGVLAEFASAVDAVPQNGSLRRVARQLIGGQQKIILAVSECHP